MDGISSGNSQGISKAFGLFFKVALVIMCLVYSAARSQCDIPATEWLDKLANIENTGEAIGVKIAQLSSLQAKYDLCSQNPDSIHARMLHRLGDFYRLNGDFEKGIKLTSEAVTINKRNDPRSEEAYLTNSYYNLGLFHVLLGLSKNAHLYFDSCIATGVQFPEKMFIALMALEKKSFLYFQVGDYEQSIATAEHGIVLARRQNLPDYEALLLIQKAQSESELDRISEAETDIDRALSILNQHDLDVYLPNAWSVYAHVLGRKKAFDKAIWYYNSASELNAAQQNTAQSARDLNDLALLYDRGLNDSKNSIAHYNRAVSVLEKLKDPWLLAAAYNNLGLVSWRNNDFKSALEYYQKGLTALPIRFSETSVIENPAISQLQSASNAYIPAALLWNKGDAWLGLYDIEKDEVLLERALDAYRHGDRMVDQMRWKQQGEQSKFYWREKTKRWYERAVEASFLLNAPSEAFYFMEKSRAVLLNDKLAELGAKNQLPPKEAEREKQLRIRLQSIEARATETPSRNFTGDDDLWQARHDLNNFIKRLENAYPAYYAYKYDTTVFSLADLQRSLGGIDQSWLELFTNDTTIYALTVTAHDAELKRIAFEGHARVAKSITDLCSGSSSINRNFSRYHELSHLYYSEVFKPLNIRAGRVTVSQDEYFLPFDLLQTDPAEDTSFLLKDYAFSYAYSASHFLRNKEKKESAGRSLLAMAPVNYDSRLQLPDLQGADLSLEKIESSFKDGVYLTNGSATRTQFLKQIPDFDLIHLYSHATADTLGNDPVIYFYDSALNLSELQNLPRLRTRLIVLFACNTGVGKSIKGEGILSLARGFASAGIPSTVSALWEIDSKTTYKLAELFFTNLAKGQPSDIALQQAKLEIIGDHGKEYELPYFWAGTVLIGKPEFYSTGDARVLSGRSKFILFGGLIFLLGAVVFFVNRRRLMGGTH